MPCTNVPTHCPLCPLSFTGNPQAMWEYNALYHLISEYSSDGIIPEIPGELLVKMFIHRAEEEVLGIDQNATEKITKSLIVMDLQWLCLRRIQRCRSETMSTNLFDKHYTNRP